MRLDMLGLLLLLSLAAGWCCLWSLLLICIRLLGMCDGHRLLCHDESLNDQ